jgi:hypothetical protein
MIVLHRNSYIQRIGYTTDSNSSLTIITENSDQMFKHREDNA